MSIGSVTAPYYTGNSQAQSAQDNLSSDLDNFLMILTTQLQNQDPLSPLDTHEFTNQLVMFADVEQSIQQNANLEKMLSLQGTNQAIGAVSYMGQNVKVDYNAFPKKAEETKTLEYTLPQDAKTATIQVFDAQDNLVYTGPAETSKGTHSFEWEGKDGDGNHLPEGAYSFQIKAVDSDDKAIEEDLKYSVSGQVESVEYADGQTILHLGDVPVNINRVEAILNPNTSNSADSGSSS